MTTEQRKPIGIGGFIICIVAFLIISVIVRIAKYLFIGTFYSDGLDGTSYNLIQHGFGLLTFYLFILVFYLTNKNIDFGGELNKKLFYLLGPIVIYFMLYFMVPSWVI